MYGVCSFTVLWGVVNNAGVNLRSDVELTSMKYFERLNDVNYLGMVRVTKQFLPLIRKAKGKRQIFINFISTEASVSGSQLNILYDVVVCNYLPSSL